jgi:predicted RND superfamily exporter protein
MHDSSLPDSPVIHDLKDFDQRSGSFLERLFFNHRGIVVVLCLLITGGLGFQMSKLELQANFERMIPTAHPYIVNYLAHKDDLKGLGNSVRIAVEAKHGSILDPAYLDTLKKINDEVFLIPGVDRAFMKSLWTPSTRWLAVTEDGLDGGPVLPDSFDGTAKSVDQLRTNIERSGELGQIVSNNYKSSLVVVPIVDKDGAGKPIDYHQLSAALERVRAKYQSDAIGIHITGFAKVVGDLIDGLQQVLLFLFGAVALAAAVLYWYTRCLRSTLLVVSCSAIAVVWLLGLLPTIGYQLDPYSILVPFLVFAIGMSHGAQKMNGIMQDVGRGTHRLIAARYTFRRLFLAGLTALLADAVGFMVLMVIGIQVIRDLAVAASIGVAVLIFTNLLLLPVLLSYTGVSPKAARRSLADEGAMAGKGGAKHWFWQFLDLFTTRKWATGAIVVSAMLGVAGFFVSLHLQVGDLDPGAPELRAESRYNRDNAFIAANYAASSDVLVIMVSTPKEQCQRYSTVLKTDELERQLQQLPGVESTNSFATLAKRVTAGLNEGNMKWGEILRNQDSLNTVTSRAPREIYNQDCDLLLLYAYLKDHKAETLSSVVTTVEAFARDNNTAEVKFLLGAGNAGIEAATNIVVARANIVMLALVYLAVIALCLVTFRSWRATVCAILPLMLTSVLCEALMVGLKIGVKVATLPVIALGVGIGIDYALYVLAVTLARMREGHSLSDAYHMALQFTGRVVVLTGLTLAVGVVTWALSPIKFQADMGILLAFMFLWNMLGALILLPALGHFLLRPTPAQAVPAVENEKAACIDDVAQRRLTNA